MAVSRTITCCPVTTDSLSLERDEVTAAPAPHRPPQSHLGRGQARLSLLCPTSPQLQPRQHGQTEVTGQEEGKENYQGKEAVKTEL